ncbi:MAG: hypothetical protein ACUVV4_00410 [Candidatus Bathyarchaeia archaeon]
MSSSFLQAYEYMMTIEVWRGFQSTLQILMIIPGAFGAFREEVFKQTSQMDEIS